MLARAARNVSLDGGVPTDESWNDSYEDGKEKYIEDGGKQCDMMMYF